MEETVCVVCAQFEPQTWRKSLCKNCFHTDAEHTDQVNETTPAKQANDEQHKGSTGIGASQAVKETVSVHTTTSKSVAGGKLLTKSNSNLKPGSFENKNKDTEKSDAGKPASKQTVKQSSEVGKRLPVVVSKQIPDSKVQGKTTNKEKKLNGVEAKLRTLGTKDSVTRPGQKEDAKTGDAKALHSTETGQVTRQLASGNSRQNGGGGGPSKVKHLLRSFGTDEHADARAAEKNVPCDLDKKPARSDSDVTSKCQVVEASHVTSKTLVIGREKDVPPASVVRTVPISTGSSRSNKVSVGRPEDGNAGNKSPSITISLRGGVTDIKLGKSDSRGKILGSSDTKARDAEKARDLEVKELKAKEKELLELKAREKQLLAKEKEYNELKAREKELKELRAKERDLKAKEKEYERLLAKEKELEKLKCKEREIRDKENEIRELKLKEQELRNLKAKEVDIKSKEDEIRKQEDALYKLKSKLTEMEKKCRQLEDENTTLKRTSIHGPKEDAEKIMEELRNQLSSMEGRCSKLESDNTSLMKELKDKEEVVKRDSHGESEEWIDLGQKLRDSEKDVGQVDDENAKLKVEIRELREEMDEMYDTFRENEVDEFRDLQKELEITAKNCRILQFKLRKAERRNEQVEADKTTYEDRLRILQNQFESEDTRAHIRKVEDELRMAKDVSVRLHDEIDLLEDKKAKAEEDSRHLTELLEQADKKQFRMEMEIDKLRDQIMDLKQELKYAGKEELSNRKTPLGAGGRQGSGEYDVSQVMRDLYDSIERENDLKEQLRFTEEETKMMRKKLSELEEENESLNIQIRKMSRSNKRRELREKERFIKESEEGDSDTDSMGDIDVRIQCELLEQELAVVRKKVSDGEHESERLREEVRFLQEKVEEKTQLLSIKPEPSSPNAYYEDKIKHMTIETDDLKWKIIEKEREIERLCAQMNFIQHSHRQQQGKLKKSKSLDSDTQEISDLRRQMDQVAIEAGATRERLAQVVTLNEKLSAENENLKATQIPVCRIPSIQADDAAVENIELRDKVRKLDDDNRTLQDNIKTLTESLQTLTKDSRMRPAEDASIPGSRNADMSRDVMMKHLESLQAENSQLRRKMAEVERASSQGGSEEAARETDDQKTEAGDRNMERDPEDMTRLQLVEKVLDLEDEILDLKSTMKHKDLMHGDLEREVSDMKRQRDEDEDESRKKEREMVEELEMLHEKNSVLSNLLEIVTERADRAEQEIEMLMKAEHSSTSDRSASQVSALSNASVGSDDVFLTPPPGEKSGIINRDWDRQMKKRVDSLERLLAEERLKVATAEKKLLLITQESVSTAMSDDSKLHLREKELLQHELIESQKHLKIATDQMKGMKERLYVLEEEHSRLKVDYGRVCEQLDQLENSLYDSDKTPEGDIEPEDSEQKRPLPPLKIPHRQKSLDAMTVEQKCAMYKLKAEELQYKVEEINDIWRSKSAASEEEKACLEAELKQKGEDIRVMRVMLEKVKDELCEKEKVITISETTIKEKGRAINRRDEILQEQDEALKQRDLDFTTIMVHIAQKDDNIRELRDAVRNRDERLKEKDDILCKLNQSLDGRQRDLKMLSDKIKESSEQLTEKDAVISVLQQQISHNTVRDAGGETDVEKVNSRLTETLRARQTEIDGLKVEKQNILKELQTSRNAFDEAMVSWDKDKVYFDSQLKVADEKIKLYETLPSMNKEEIQKALQSDAQHYFQEKEKLACDLSNAHREHETTVKQLVTQTTKLESEIGEKDKQLRQEVELINKQQQDLERLSSQAELAYRLQQDERVIRAEYLAMKVRYETRFEKMWKDYSKMLVTIEKLQKERDLDKAIIQGMQRGMASLRDNYTADTVWWEDEKARLERQIKEIDETRELANGLKNKIQDLKEQISDQDRSRTDMVNKFATERSSWDIERAILRSKVNQLEEKVVITSRAQTRVRDIQSNMEVTWERERMEQKRLLEKAHKLALDLQEQLKSRDESYSQERRALLQQVGSERQSASQDRKERDIALGEMEACGKKLLSTQKQCVELVETQQKEGEARERERNGLLRRLAELKQTHIHESRHVSDILSNFVRLRELGSLVAGGRDGGEEDKILDKNVIKCIRESMADISTATDKLSALMCPPQDSIKIRRSLSSSEIALLKEELGGLGQSEEREATAVESVSRLQKSNTFDTSNTSFTPLYPNTVSTSSQAIIGLRSTTPTREFPSTMHRSVSPIPLVIPSPSSSVAKTPRPKILQKSISVDAVPSRKSVFIPGGQAIKESLSSCNTPTETSSPSASLSPPQVGSLDRLSPRSARRKFFEERPVSDIGFLSWPERKQYAVTPHQKQVKSNIPDPSDIRKVAEEGHSLISKSDAKPVSQIKPSLSWDEKMHYRVVHSETTEKPHPPGDTKPPHTETSLKTTAKEKRRFFKKSSSLEGPVGSSLAKMGTQVMPFAAPTGFAPTDIFATVRGKLKLPFRKSKDSKSPSAVPISVSPDTMTAHLVNTSTTCTDTTTQMPGTAHIDAHSDTAPQAHVTDEMQTSLEQVSWDKRSRGGSREPDQTKQDQRWRSRSAERPQSTRPLLESADSVLAANQMWQFSETAV